MGMKRPSALHAVAFAVACTITTAAAAAESEPPRSSIGVTSGVTDLTLFTGAGYLTSGGGTGGAIATGVRLGVGRRFALGLDFGYGVMGLGSTMQDRWWVIPSMAVVVPVDVGRRRAAFDIGAGLGLGTSSGYAGGWSEYAAHPFTATWEYQLVPAVRAHAIASLSMTPTLELFARADAAALVLPHGAGATVTDSTWLLFSMGTRFELL